MNCEGGSLTGREVLQVTGYFRRDGGVSNEWIMLMPSGGGVFRRGLGLLSRACDGDPERVDVETIQIGRLLLGENCQKYATEYLHGFVDTSRRNLYKLLPLIRLPLYQM